MSLRRAAAVFVLIALMTLSCTKGNVIQPKSYLELNLNDNIISSPFSRRSSPLEVFRVIEKAAADDKITGIILNIGSINHSRDYLWELRDALEKFKASGVAGEADEHGGKKIVAYISNADIDSYMLASVADKIVMDELGMLTMLGYSAGRGFLSQTMEKLGIGVQELRYFEYKTAMESYTRTNMSEADRRQYSDYLDDTFNLTRSALMEVRGWTLEEFNSIINKNFIHSAQSALTYNLVDYTGGLTAVQDAISEIENLIPAFRLYGDTETSLTNGSPYTVTRKKNAPTIAVVYANGETDMSRGMEIAKLSKIINELGNNDRIKAIVVRVNSPGGSAQASEVLANEINLVKTKKPVVVSMGQVAASGGYWVSMNASHIMANPYTITGSIGVIGNWLYDNGMYNKLGVSVDVLKRGDHSDLMTGFFIPYRKLTSAEEEQFKKMILNLYDIFLQKVAIGRNMDIEEVKAVAQGRIFSGSRALEEGLVDSVGSLYDALNTARELAGISEDTVVNYKEYPEPKLMDILMGKFMAKAGEKYAPAFLDSFADAMLQDIRYRLENNGKAMPILPLEFSVID